MEGLSKEERRALRGSKFAPLPPPPRSHSQEPRLAHPGGPLKTNKAAALAKFLERKLQNPDGLASINTDLLHLAVQSAKCTVFSSGTSTSGIIVRHVTPFVDSEESFEEGKIDEPSVKQCKKRKKKMEKTNKNDRWWMIMTVLS